MKGKTKSGVQYVYEKVLGETDTVHLRLVSLVGSLCENEQQRGAAHFIEHLGFRGTRKYDHGELVSLIESLGASFGPDLNAKTSLSNTIWQLDIPSSSLKTGLSILNEWAFWIRISEEDVDAERKVILEEWRQKQTAAFRAKAKFWDAAAPLVSTRMPIGTVDFIQTATKEQLRMFYESTYVSDELFIVCVVEEKLNSNCNVSQQIDFDHLQAEMEQVFSLENCPRRGPRRITQIPKTLSDLCYGNRERMKSACVVDPDLSHSCISIEILSDSTAPSTDLSFFRRDAVKRILSSVIDERFREKRLEADHSQNSTVSFGLAIQYPYVEMSCVRAELRYKFTIEDVENAMVTLARELISFAKIGFSKNEVEHAKIKWQRTISDRIRRGGAACEEWVEHFSLNERTPAYGFEEEQQLLKQFFSPSSRCEHSIQFEEVNSLCKSWLQSLFHHSSSDVLLLLFQSPSLVPGLEEDTLKRAFHRALELPVENNLEKVNYSYQEEYLRKCLMDWHMTATEIPVKNQFKHTVELLPKSDAYVHEYWDNNGERFLKICLKKRESKLISLQAFAKGGASELVDQSDHAAFSIACDVLRESGIHTLTGSELNRLEASTGARVFIQRHLHHRGLGGSCPPHEIDLLFSMVASRMLQKHHVKEKVLERIKRREIESIQINSATTDEAMLNLREVAFGNKESLLLPHSMDDFHQVDVSRVSAVVQAAFGNSSEFTFCLIGPYEENDIQQTLHRFAGLLLLGKNGKKERKAWCQTEGKINPMNLQFIPNSTRCVYVGQTITDKSQIVIVLKVPDCPLHETPKYDHLFNMTCDAVRSHLISKLRTSQGDVYSISTEYSRTSLSEHGRVFITFSASQSKDTELVQRVVNELRQISIWGFTDEEVSNTIAAMQTRRSRAVTESHELFRILDAFKVSNEDHTLVDEIASELGLFDMDLATTRQLLKENVRELLSAGVASLVIRYCPQKL